MYKLLNQITALALVPHVMSRQLKTTVNSSKNWIVLTDDLLWEYERAGGLFLKPGQEMKFCISYPN